MPGTGERIVVIVSLCLSMVCQATLAQEKPEVPQLQPLFTDDFSTDTRDDYQIQGEVKWNAGELRLRTGAMLGRVVNAGSWAEAELDLEIPKIQESESASLEFTWHLSGGANDLSVKWEITPEQKVSIYFIEHKRVFGFLRSPREIKVCNLNRFQNGIWRLGYRNGLLSIRSPKPPEMEIPQEFRAYTYTNATVSRVTLEPRAGAATLIEIRMKGSIPPALLSSLQRKKMADASEQRAKAIQLYQQGQPAAALEIFEGVHLIYRGVLGTQHPDYATILSDTAVLYQSMSNYAQAERLHLEALKIRKNVLGTEHPHYSNSLNNLAELYRSMGYYSKAELQFRQSRDIRKKVLGTEHPEYARILNNLALLHASRSDYVAAERLYLEAHKIYKKVFGTEHPEYASSLMSLASLYQEIGDYDRAAQLHRESLEIKKNKLGTEHPEYATGINHLGHLYQSKGDYTQAEPLYLKAHEIFKKKLGTKHPRYAASLNLLAYLYQAMGDYVQAEPLHREALVICKNVLGAKHPYYIQSLNNLACLYISKREYELAEPLFREAIEICAETMGTEHLDYAKILNNLAQLYHSRSDYTQAEPLTRQTVEIMRKKLSATAAIQSERQQLAMLKSYRSYLHYYISIGMGAEQSPKRLFSENLLWKGAIFVRQQAFRQLRKINDSETQKQLAELTEVARRRAILSFQIPTSDQAPAWRKQLASLAAKQEQLEAGLGKRSARFSKGEQVAELTPEQLQKLLPTETVLIDFLEYSDRDPQTQKWTRRLLAFVVTKTDIAAIDLGEIASLKLFIDQWRARIDQGVDTDSVTQELRKQLWQPISQQLSDKITTIIISPDGILNSVPFAALPGDQPASYLLEEKTIVTIPFPQMLKLWQDAGQPLSNGNLLLVGDVDFNRANQEAVPQTHKSEPLLVSNTLDRGVTGNNKRVFPPLPETKREIRQLSLLHQKVFDNARKKQLSGSIATEELFRQSVGDQQIIHLATHGFFAPPEVISLARTNDPQLERMQMMSFGNEQDSAFGRAVGYPPGVLSGVVLAGANKPLPADDFTSDDGILTASEVQELNLGGTELVVLSACETGLGQVAGGEGVLGLQRAFHLAGARNVVTSLWSVDDNATAALMSLFYHNLWEKKQAVSVALRNAQLALLNHPEVIGDEDKLTALTTRGLDFSNPKKIDPNTKLKIKPKRTPIHLWAAFTHSGPPPIIVP